MNRRALLVIFCSMLLTACSTVPRPVIHPDLNPAQVQIAEAAKSVSHSLAELAAVNAAATPPITSKSLTNAHARGMTGNATINWSGPIGALVQQIAKVTHYKLRVLGNAPSIPIIISINAHNTPIGDILRNADFQAGRGANIYVYQQSQVIELRYAHT